jgi:hypothetical protein
MSFTRAKKAEERARSNELGTTALIRRQISPPYIYVTRKLLHPLGVGLNKNPRGSTATHVLRKTPPLIK